MKRKVVSIVLAIVMVLSLMTITTTTAAPNVGKTIYFEDFDGTTGNWGATNGSGTVFTLKSTDGVDEGYYAHIEAGESNTLFKPNVGLTSKKMVMEFDYRGDNIGSGAGKYIYLSENPSYGRIYLSKGGFLTMYSRESAAVDKTEAKAFQLEPNVWHHIKWEIEFETSKQSIYLDDEEKPFETAFVDGISDSPNVKYIVVRSDTNSGYMDLDNIRIYDPDGVETATPTPKPAFVPPTPSPTKDPNATPTPKPNMLKTLYSEDFEGATRMWASDPAVFSIKNTDGVSEGNYAHLEASEGSALYKQNLKSTPYGDNLIIEFDCRGNNYTTGSGKYIYLDENASMKGRIYLGNKGALIIANPQNRDNPVAFELEPDVWHHVKWELDFAQKKQRVYLDDETDPFEIDYDSTLFDKPAIKQMIVRIDKDAGYLDLDNIVVYNPEGKDPEPTPAPTPVPTKEPTLFPDTANTSYEKATNAIGALGIITGYEDGTFGPNKNITRAEFATIVARSFNLTEASTAETFSDVPADHWAKGYIGAAKNAGIINGFEDGTFKPNDNVTEEQAVKMIVAALGYTEEATAAGGYPNGYIRVANEKKMNTGLVISGKKDATRGRIAILMYNSLDIPVKGQTATIREMNTK